MSLSDYDDISELLVSPGRLVITPTDLTAAFPHGGTSLGMTDNGILLNRAENYEIIATEAKGQVPQKVIHLGEVFFIQAELIQWDDAVLAQLFKGYTTTGAVSEKKNLTWPGDGTYYEGQELSAQSVILAFIPEDISTGKVVVARKAVPLGISLDMLFRASEKVSLPIRFLVLEDTAIGSSDDRYEYRGLFMGDIQDVSLSA